MILAFSYLNERRRCFKTVGTLVSVVEFSRNRRDPLIKDDTLDHIRDPSVL